MLIFLGVPLSPIIIGSVENYPPNERKLLLEIHLFFFTNHDYGRKGQFSGSKRNPGAKFFRKKNGCLKLAGLFNQQFQEISLKQLLGKIGGTERWVKASKATRLQSSVVCFFRGRQGRGWCFFTKDRVFELFELWFCVTWTQSFFLGGNLES